MKAQGLAPVFLRFYPSSFVLISFSKSGHFICVFRAFENSMFPFKKPPSRLESARNAVSGAVSEAANSLSDTIFGAAGTAAQVAESLSQRAHDLIENAPIESTVAGAAEKLDALKAGAVAGVAGAGAGIAGAGAKVADKIASVRDKSAEKVEAAETVETAEAVESAEAVETAEQEVAPDARATREQAQADIDFMQSQAKQYKREFEAQLKRQKTQFEAAIKRANSRLEAEQARVERETKKLDNARRKREDREPLPVAPTDEIYADDEVGEPMDDYDAGDFDADYAQNYGKKKGGGGWLLFGGLLLAGAVYYLFSTTGGKRSKAAIQDRIGQVASGEREAKTGPSDANGETVIEAASEALDRSNEKIGAPAGETLPDKAVAAAGDIGDKVADGIESVGDFIADKLEAAGAGAKNVAHSAVEKLDEAKGKNTTIPANLPATTAGAAALPPGTVVPEGVTVVEVTELPQGETTDEILAEVEATVKQIEDSVRAEKK